MKLTAALRRRLPKKDFALPPDGYPIEDKAHARTALSRASANASPAQQARIRAKVHAKFPTIGKPAGNKAHKRKYAI
jgi:hypothetical protein